MQIDKLMEKKFFIGIDLGGTKIKGIICGLDGSILSEYTIATDAEEGEQAVFNRILSTIDEVIREWQGSIQDIKAIGIGSPGPLNPREGMITNPANLPFNNFNIVKPIFEKYKIPTYLDNDANVAAIGEYMFGAGKGTQNMIYVTVSTGIGGGAIINKKIYRGHTNNSLEVGHTTILPDGPKCNCGNYGCLEVLASGTAIGRQAREAVKSGEITSLSKYQSPTAQEVFKEAAIGDKVSQEILDRSLTYLGIGISNIITNFDPEIVIIGGGVSKGGEIVFDKVREVVSKRCMKTYVDSCKILPAELGTDAGAIGAAALAIMEDM